MLEALAPAKVNLSLFVGPVRDDGRHELVTVMDTVSLADTVRLVPGAAEDEVVCPGVTGPNLAGAALAAFRAHTGWDGPPVRLEIDKRIPVAGGMAGGSADAAAALRLAAAAAGHDDLAALERIAATLGADVPSQVRGGRVLATGAGEVLRPLGPAAPYAVLVVPVDAGLSAGAVYAEADRLTPPRDAADLAARRAEIEAGAEPVHNDLQAAALALCPEIGDALAAVRDAGADHALVSGSGPTTLGLFTGSDGESRARAAAAALGRPTEVALPVPAGAGRVRRAAS